MRPLAIQPRFVDLRGLVIGAWRWWTGELLAMVPPALASSLRHRRAILTIDLAGEEVIVRRIAGDEAGEILCIRRSEIEAVRLPTEVIAAIGGGAVLVRLPAQDILRRTVILPLAARRDLRRILEFELDRQCPIDPNQVHFGYRVKARDRRGNRLEVELRLVRRETIEDAISLSRALGLEPTAVSIAGDPLEAEDGGLLPPGRRPARPRLRQRANALLALGAFVLAVAFLAAHVLRHEAAMMALAAEVADARTAARATAVVARKVDQERQREDFLARQKDAPLFSKVLAEVSRRLPDGSWVFEFEVHGREVRLHGFSPQASNLIALIDDAPMFANARFRAPLTRDAGSEVDRFDLSFDVKMAQP